jgi:hypothetical protein
LPERDPLRHALTRVASWRRARSGRGLLSAAMRCAAAGDAGVCGPGRNGWARRLRGRQWQELVRRERAPPRRASAAAMARCERWIAPVN